MSAPDLPRFKVATVTGYALNPPSAIPNAARRRERAEQRCAELEAWHEQAMADG